MLTQILTIKYYHKYWVMPSLTTHREDNKNKSTNEKINLKHG